MAVAEKLAPPIIDSTIPAFCREFYRILSPPLVDAAAAGYYTFNEETHEYTPASGIITEDDYTEYYASQFKIVVPFQHSKTYTPVPQNNDITYKFALKIKTAQSNIFITTIYTEQTVNEFTDGRAIFYVRDAGSELFQTLKLGSYYKFQLAYVKCSTVENTVGYYSTVAIGKYTSQPIIGIEGYDLKYVNYFKQTVTGTYSNQEITEKPYSYRFILFKNNGSLESRNIIEDSGWQMHEFSMDDTVSTVEYKYRDTYHFETIIPLNEQFFVEYQVRTINNYIIPAEDNLSLAYKVYLTEIQDLRDIIDLVGENNFDNAYIKLNFQLSESKKTQFSDSSLTEGVYIRVKQSDKERYDSWDIVPYKIKDNIDTPTSFKDFELITDTIDWDNINDSSNIYYLQKFSDIADFFPVELRYQPLSLIVERADDRDEFSAWQRINLINFKKATDISDFSFKDYTIEQGLFYQYRFAICDKRGYVSSYHYSNFIYSDFEDMFLFDGVNNIKIRFNPKISSFKQTILESKIDTIGSKYPFFFRNGIVKYKEFPINGLISYIMDDDIENEFFTLNKKIYVSGYNNIQLNQKIFSSIDDDLYYLPLNNNIQTLNKIKRAKEEEEYFYSSSLPSSQRDLVKITDKNRMSVLSSSSTKRFYKLISLFDKNYKFQKLNSHLEIQKKINNNNTNLFYSRSIPWSNLALGRVQNGHQFNANYLYYELIPVFNENIPRDETSSEQEIRRNIFATSLTGYTVRTEREFKMKLLEWLNNGKIKMFKSPYEGNFLIRLMNISLTPNDQLGRMLHTFQAQAYEVADFTYSNLGKNAIVSNPDYDEVLGSLYVLQQGELTEVGSIVIDDSLNSVINTPIEEIPTSLYYTSIVNTSDATASSGDLRKGQVAYARGYRLIGTFEPDINIQVTTQIDKCEKISTSLRAIEKESEITVETNIANAIETRQDLISLRHVNKYKIEDFPEILNIYYVNSDDFEEDTAYALIDTTINEITLNAAVPSLSTLQEQNIQMKSSLQHNIQS